MTSKRRADFKQRRILRASYAAIPELNDYYPGGVGGAECLLAYLRDIERFGDKILNEAQPETSAEDFSGDLVIASAIKETAQKCRRELERAINGHYQGIPKSLIASLIIAAHELGRASVADPLLAGRASLVGSRNRAGKNNPADPEIEKRNEEICLRVADGMPRQKVARRYRISVQRVGQIVRKKKS